MVWGLDCLMDEWATIDSSAVQEGCGLNLDARTKVHLFDWHHRSCRWHRDFPEEGSVDAVHFGPVSYIANVDRALHDVLYRAAGGFHDGSNVFERLGGFLGHCAFDDVPLTIDGQLSGDKQKTSDPHRLRVVAVGERR